MGCLDEILQRPLYLLAVMERYTFASWCDRICDCNPYYLRSARRSVRPPSQCPQPPDNRAAHPLRTTSAGIPVIQMGWLDQAIDDVRPSNAHGLSSTSYVYRPSLHRTPEARACVSVARCRRSGSVTGLLSSGCGHAPTVSRPRRRRLHTPAHAHPSHTTLFPRIPSLFPIRAFLLAYP
ncbi:hypothetical protein DFH06DRAFT_114695 [Mycena polygramma]|nr:hypothetical protein DFH06DRAFT_114695 [Mycena polygramma]